MPRSAARCPTSFGQSYHWSLMQVEYATDLVFRSTTTLRPLYEQLTRETVLSVKAEQIATFLGRRSRRCSPKRSARNSPPASRAPASSIASASARSRCMTNSVSSCVSRPPPTTRDGAPVQAGPPGDRRDGHPLGSSRRTFPGPPSLLTPAASLCPPTRSAACLPERCALEHDRNYLSCWGFRRGVKADLSCWLGWRPAANAKALLV